MTKRHEDLKNLLSGDMALNIQAFLAAAPKSRHSLPLFDLHFSMLLLRFTFKHISTVPSEKREHLPSFSGGLEVDLGRQLRFPECIGHH